jgi:hypothetical protein
MLIYEPEHRATAQEMLKNPWFDMESNFDYKMSEREYEKMNIVKKNNKIEKKNANEKDIIESDIELNGGDFEDNDDECCDDDDDDSYENHEPTDTINIQNFNNSFAIYGQHVKLSALDKANPQFK